MIVEIDLGDSCPDNPVPELAAKSQPANPCDDGLVARAETEKPCEYTFESDDENADATQYYQAEEPAPEAFGDDSDVLRRADQLQASREDSPPKKGKGRGRGRGKGKGRGRGRKTSKACDDMDWEGGEPAPKTRKRRSKHAETEPPQISQPAEPAEPLEPEGEDPAAAESKPKRKRVKGDEAKDKKERAQGKEKRKESTRKTDPAPKKRTKKVVTATGASPVEDAEDAEDMASDVAGLPSVAAKNANPHAVTGKQKDGLKKMIKVFQRSTVVPYWSRAAVGLKVPKSDGGTGLSQACVVLALLAVFVDASLYIAVLDFCLLAHCCNTW